LIGGLLVGGTVNATSLTISAATLTTYERTYGSSLTCTLTAVADAHLREDMPATASGADVTLDVQPETGSRRRSLVRFDLAACSPAVPADAITHSASLRLTLAASATQSRTYAVSRATGSWSEATVTWDGQPGVASPTASLEVAAGTAAGSVVEWSVVSDVQDFVSGANMNYGWRISDAAEGAAQLGLLQFRSREAATGLPTLVITYVG
jgi:hypothetical protein